MLSLSVTKIARIGSKSRYMKQEARYSKHINEVWTILFTKFHSFTKYFMHIYSFDRDSSEKLHRDIVVSLN